MFFSYKGLNVLIHKSVLMKNLLSLTLRFAPH